MALQVSTAQVPAANVSESADPVALERIRQALTQPQQSLRIPPPPASPTSSAPPTFRVTVEGVPLETPLDVVRRELAAQPFPDQADIPLAGIRRTSGGTDVLPAIMGAVHKVQRARYQAAERRIHREVSEELEALCQVNDCSQVNEGLLLPPQ